MTYERFLKIITEIEKQDKLVSALYDLKVDLIDWTDPYSSIIGELIKEIYGEEGYDWFSWFCYERNFGNEEIGAWDENSEPICYDVKSLWECLEKIPK
tara:strand:- start:125 stop:418 length:294 start_codon:yes stop_codon:yes gene_type:complete